MSAISLTDPTTIASLCEALTRAGVDGIEITTPEGHVRITVEAGKGVEVAHNKKRLEHKADTFIIKAPIAGRFRPLAIIANENEKVIEQGDIIGSMAVGPILVPVAAPHGGMVRRTLAEPDVLVGFATPLFELEKTS